MIFTKNNTDKLDCELFKNPTAEYRGLPFWSWNCKIEKQTIDEINILQATRLGMKRAIEGLGVPPDFVLTDGNMTLDILPPQRSIVKGDALVCSIGAASIIAKVYRDELMQKFAEEFPGYGFEKNVGYGTKQHISAIKEVGICRIHRRTFIKNFWDGRERT